MISEIESIPWAPMIHDDSTIIELDDGKIYRKALSHRIHGAAIYGNMDPLNIPP